MKVHLNEFQRISLKMKKRREQYIQLCSVEKRKLQSHSSLIFSVLSHRFINLKNLGYQKEKNPKSKDYKKAGNSCLKRNSETILCFKKSLCPER